MPSDRSDIDILRHMLRYCDQIADAHQDYGFSKERFAVKTAYQNAVSMCIFQIGELVNHLSKEFQANHDEIPWHKIRGMRNYIAHAYGTLDMDIVWSAATVSIKELRTFCEHYLEQ